MAALQLFAVLLVSQDLKALLVFVVRLVQLVFKELVVPRDKTVPTESRVPPVLKDLRVTKVQLVLVAHLVILDLVVPRVTLVMLAPLVMLVLLVSADQRV